MTRIRLQMLATFVVACLLLGVRTCSAQFAIATSSATAGGATASAGGVAVVAQLPQFGFGSNGFGFNGFGLNTNLNPFNNFPANNRHGNRPGNGRPAPPATMQWSINWNGGGRQPATGWGNWESQGGHGGCGFNCAQTGSGGAGGGNWEYNSWWSDRGSAAPPGWGTGGRPPPGWQNGGRPPPGWQNVGGRPPGWQNGGGRPQPNRGGGNAFPPSEWEDDNDNNNGQPRPVKPQPGGGGGNAFPPPEDENENGQNPPVPSNGSNNGQPRPVNPQQPNKNGNSNPPTPRPRPSKPLPTTNTTPGTLIIGKNPPPLIISPTPPPNQGGTLIVGTNRPPLVPPAQPTPSPTPATYFHSPELSRLRDIIFPSSSQYVANPIEEAPADAIDIR